jgi:hypothetical protein
MNIIKSIFIFIEKTKKEKEIQEKGIKQIFR